MAFERHPTFKPAPTKESKLWRYMGLPKYLSLLQSGALFFCNLEIIARTDPFEGTLPSSRFKHRNWNTIDDLPEGLRNRGKEYLKNGEAGTNTYIKGLKDLAELRIRQAYAYRRSYFINCWYLCEFDSPAMWDIFSKKSEGIAIRSSEYRFEKAFSETEQSVMGGKIEYGNFFDDTFLVDDNNAFSPVLHKRRSFSYENEYRLVHWDTALVSKKIKSKNGYFIWDDKIVPDRTGSSTINVSLSIEEIENLEIKHGVNIKCDKNELIEAIVIAPLSENWFVEVVKNISKKYGLKAPLIKSELISEPLK